MDTRRTRCRRASSRRSEIEVRSGVLRGSNESYEALLALNVFEHMEVHLGFLRSRDTGGTSYSISRSTCRPRVVLRVRPHLVAYLGVMSPQDGVDLAVQVRRLLAPRAAS
jgi:hypothetical protein